MNSSNSSRNLMVVISMFLIALSSSCKSADSSSGLKKIRAARKSQTQAKLSALKIDYNYAQAAKEPAATDQTKIALRVRDDRLTSASKPVAELEIIDLQDYDNNRVVTSPLVLTGDKDAHIEVKGLKPNSVYQIWVTIYNQDIESAQKTAIGYVPLPYYWVTNGPNPSDVKRQNVVRKSLQRYYYARKGWAGNMDCWQFCRHYSADDFPTWNRRTHYGKSIPALASQGPIHGDYVRIPDYHSFLILSYNKKKNIVWSVEGNFGSTIEVIQRRLNSSWRVSHHK
jgi:hypothetical protein